MVTLNIVILAAGKGTRMYSDKPKVLHQIAGKSLLRHVVDAAISLDPYKIIVVHGHGGEQVQQEFASMPVQFAKQEPQLGTGHAVQQAMPMLDDDGITLVLYGDVPLIQVRTLEKLSAESNSLTILTQILEDPKGYGRIVRDSQGSVTSIVEEKDASDEQRKLTEVNTGILAAPTNLLREWLSRLSNVNIQGEYYLTDIVAMAVEQGIAIHTSQPNSAWEVIGINNKMQLSQLERMWQAEQAKRLLTQGVTIIDPSRIEIRGELTCESDVEIDIGCIFEGRVHLGKGVKVNAYCVVKDSSVAAGSCIETYSHIVQAEIGECCKIGPYARIRPGSKLANEVHIGNFVEIKNSQIASKSKANHLSYIGDASIGGRVNIGAGTITCNYDGANKFRTVIEDDVFIGSDTQLVAPVTISSGSTIGAGSTIVRDTPAGELSLSRSKQVNVSGWQRPVKKTSEN